MAKIDEELLSRLKDKLQVKRSRVYQLIEKEARATLLPRDLAAAALAWQSGLSIYKFVDQDEIERIRRAVGHGALTGGQAAGLTKKSSKSRKRRSGPRVPYIDPFVDDEIVNASIRNAQVYPILYVFENSVRRMIAAVMAKEFGHSWWESQVHASIQQSVEIRRSEEKGYPWHSQRGAEPIYYTDISDLRRIINSHNRVFAKAFGKIPHVELWIEEIEKTRNTLAHNNPISKKDRERLLVYARDWSEFAKSVFPKL